MRCLVVADLHYSLPQFDWLIAAAPQFDLVIFVPAMRSISARSSIFRAQIVVVKKYLALLSRVTRVVLCSGNHDLDERNPEGEKISRWVGEMRELGIACDGDSFALGDTLFTVCPWWDGPLVKARIENQLRDAAAERLKRWVWVHHAPPPRIRRRAGAASGFSATSNWCKWIGRYQPSMVIFRPWVPVAVHPRRVVVRPASARPGSSTPGCSPAVRRSTSCSISMTARRSGCRPATRNGSTSTHRIQRPAAEATDATELAHILGSDCRSDPGRKPAAAAG